MTSETATRNTPELSWFKSSYSGGTNGESCVEVAISPAAVHIRDSKDTSGPTLTMPSDAWTHFVTYASER
jgi:hypothetical protein